MITFKKGFYITYNVGTYSIKDNGNGGKYIVSNEYSSVFNKEPKIQTRIQFFNNPHNSLNMLTEFANVDVTKVESIIKYCNKFGLPVSSSYLDIKYKGVYRGDYIVNLEEYKGINPFWEHDNMPLDEFIDHHTNVSNLLYLRNVLGSNNYKKKKYIETIASVLLFYFENSFNLNFQNEFPTTLTAFYQYIFLRSYKLMGKNDDLVSKIYRFVQIRQNNVESLSDYTYADYVKITNDDNKEFFIYYDSFLIELVQNNPSIYVDMKRRLVKFDKEVVITSQLLDLAEMILPSIMMDVINQRLARIQPILDYDSKTKVFTATWDWSSQLDGIMIELLLNLAEKSIVKKCANPTCDNYFTPLRDNRKYCCSTCAVCVVKRRQRQRAKEKAKEAKNDT